jgi:Asp-tRNA(Asn)/Glu-tRNA(Gln) amidotransferase A subunit family amidase
LTPAEQRQVRPSLEERLKTLERLRQSAFPNALDSALQFDPRPPGFITPPTVGHLRWSPPKTIRRPTNPDELAWMPIGELTALLRSRQVTSEELTRLSLDRLKQYGPALHCVVTLTESRALESARRADAEIRAGRWRGPLHGIPYGAKDLLDTRGIPTTWGVSLNTNRIPETDATVIQKLDAAGAVLVAKLSLGELAMGDVWFGGVTQNPWKPGQGSSGSSAGSASAVAAGLVPFAIGSETLGSIVSPSTRCSVTGLRPTFGRVSRTGAMTLCASMDKLGPIARSVEDCALVFDAIRGPGGTDRAVVDAGFPYPSRRSLKSLRVGYVPEHFAATGSGSAWRGEALEALRKLGIQLKPVTLPRHPTDALFLILSAEAAASFDELTRSHQDRLLVQQGDGAWPNEFRSARFISAVDYLQANRLRTRLIDDMTRLFAEIDVLVAPSFEGPLLVYSNFSGHPTVVVPAADPSSVSDASLSFTGALYAESEIVAVAKAYQAATPWNRLRPDVTSLTTSK